MDKEITDAAAAAASPSACPRPCLLRPPRFRPSLVPFPWAASLSARACAAAQITVDQTSATPAAGSSTTGTCEAAGTESTFTAGNTAFGTTTAAIAKVTASGSALLTQCAAASGFTAGTAPACIPIKV